MSEALRHSPEFEKFSLTHRGAQIEVSPALNGAGAEIKVTIPKNHKFPSLSKKEPIQSSQLLEEAEPIASFQNSLDSIVKSSFGRSVQETGDHNETIRIEHVKALGKWVIHRNLPKPILEILAYAIAHESLSRKEPSAAKADIRVQNAGSLFLKLKNSPHFDARKQGSDLSIYLLSSPPTSVQYEGEFNENLQDRGVIEENVMSYKSGKSWANQRHITSQISSSSLMPWTLFRITSSNLHSTPWESPGDGGTSKERLFIRVFFAYTS